jgi:hypothetical protein
MSHRAELWRFSSSIIFINIVLAKLRVQLRSEVCECTQRSLFTHPPLPTPGFAPPQLRTPAASQTFSLVGKAPVRSFPNQCGACRAICLRPVALRLTSSRQFTPTCVHLLEPRGEPEPGIKEAHVAVCPPTHEVLAHRRQGRDGRGVNAHVLDRAPLHENRLALGALPPGKSWGLEV